MEFHFYMVSRQSQVINSLLSFFWWYVDFLSFIFLSLLFVLPNEVILCSILSPIKSSCFCSFLNYSLRSSFYGTIPVFFCSIHQFFTIFITKFSCEWQKTVSFNVFSVICFCWISYICNVYPIISVIFTLPSISRGLLFQSLNHTWTDWNSALVIFSIVDKWGETVIN